jgi:hypothetical protein
MIDECKERGRESCGQFVSGLSTKVNRTRLDEIQFDEINVAEMRTFDVRLGGSRTERETRAELFPFFRENSFKIRKIHKTDELSSRKKKKHFLILVETFWLFFIIAKVS